MSWLTNSINCKSTCAWKCCAASTLGDINRDQFWNSLLKMKQKDYTFQPSNQFIYEKVINLNCERSRRTTFSIGLDPENKFCVAARLECKNTGATLMMNRKYLDKFMDILNTHENQILQPWSSRPLDAMHKLSIRQSEPRILEICMHGWGMNVDEDSLKTLSRMRMHIKRLICSLEQQSKYCENVFFKLLSHFYYGKTVKEARDLTESSYKQHFFEELINFHCECLNKTFIMEIALQFEQWFGVCVNYYINTLMLNESARLQTFLCDDWPHQKEYISIENLAKCGFYFIGSLDNTQCAFCDLVLYKWELHDNIILDHFKHKPRCPFLCSHKRTLNVSDVGKLYELQELMSELETVMKQEQSVDEID